jgi:hypothetical protein
VSNVLYCCRVPYDLAVVPLLKAVFLQSDGQRLMGI